MGTTTVEFVRASAKKKAWALLEREARRYQSA
jgi:hypothetical protein